MQVKKKTALALVLFVAAAITVSFFSSVASAQTSETSTVYLTWQVNNPGAGGDLSITFPRTLENGQTYKVDLTLTVEWTQRENSSVEFKTIEWLLNTGENQTQLLGYSSVDTTIQKHASAVASSYWSPSEQQTGETGTLQMNAEVVIHASNQSSETQIPSAVQISPPTQITIRSKNQLTLTLTPRALAKNDALNVTGQVSPAISGAAINVTYVKPTGEVVSRWANTDAEGKFTDTYAPTVEGTWTVKASLAESEHYVAATTDILVFKVDPQFPWIPIAAIIALAAALLGPIAARKIKKTVTE